MTQNFIKRIAQAGLVAKGVVYVILGLLAFMAAFELGGGGGNEATQTGALQFVKDLPAGDLLLLLVAAGILCYSGWRGIQTVKAGKEKKWSKMVRYLLSALAYLAFALTAIRVVGGEKSSGDQNQSMAREIMSQPFGQVLLGISGLVLAGIGAYQIYYGISEKYRKHVQGLSLQSHQATTLLRSGKVGYISRGIVWLVIAFLFVRAALHAAASEAGNSAKAFRFIESSPLGSYLLGLLGLGLMAYGVFNFIRARYEKFS